MIETTESESANDAIYFRKVSEFWTLRNRLRRYWKVLTRKALEIAKERGLVLMIAGAPEDSTMPMDPDVDIVIPSKGESVECSELLKLAKDKLPVLYRKYVSGKSRYNELHQEFGEILFSLYRRDN